MTLKSSQRLVAIVGRPNVGKSTLFNKIVKKRTNLVFDQPGVTRDRLLAKATFDQQDFFVCDTGGFEPTSQDNIKKQLVEQAELAIEQADSIIFVSDVREGLHPVDGELIKRIRKSSKPFFVAVNKCDLPQQDYQAEEFRKLGVPEIFPISAEHSRGIGALLEAATKPLAQLASPAPLPADHIKMALVGRPNVGKSSLLNRLAGEARSIVDDRPGTTRDTIDIQISYFGKTFVMLDTAGIRRKSRMVDKLERFSALRSLAAIEDCDVAVLVIDAKEGPTEGDARVAGYAYELRKPILILVNKWDLIENKTSKTAAEYEDFLRKELRYIPYSPLLFASALENQRVSRILPMCLELYNQGNRRIKTSQVNKVLKQVLVEHTPPLMKARAGRIKFYYATQVTQNPPRFVVFCNYPADIHFSYKRYVENRFRDLLEFTNIPISVFFRERSSNPLLDKNKGEILAQELGLKLNRAKANFDKDIREVVEDDDIDYEEIESESTQIVFDDEDGGND